jgi:PBP1b-binding outer membrane lipoprotein LpoB
MMAGPASGKTKLSGAVAGAAFLAAMLAGCATAQNSSSFQETVTSTVAALPGVADTSGLSVHAVRSIRQVIVHRLAVMPLIDEPDQMDKTLPESAAASITAELYAHAVSMGGWEVVPQDDVDDAMQQMAPTTPADLNQNALAMGRKVAADAVIFGTVSRYRERVGYNYAAQTPAAVAMSLYLLDEKSGQVVWTGKFAKEQKSLSENFFDLPNFIEHGARWVRAQDIAAQGIREALNDMHSKVTIAPITQGR